MKSSFVCLAIALSVGGCAINDGRPAQANMSVGDQQKLKSAAHWAVVAQDVTRELALKTVSQNVYVVPSDANTTFSKVFTSQLKSSLAAKGYTLSSTKAGAIEIVITVDSVQHVTPNRYRPGTLSALAAGVLVLREFSETARQSVGAIAGLTVAADAIISSNEINKRPDTEIVLTAVASKDGAILMHNTNIYYLDSIDLSLFTDVNRQFKIVGSTK
jgi:hypothetical protein